MRRHPVSPIPCSYRNRDQYRSLKGTLSFITYYLLKYPDVMRKLRNEIDDVIGDGKPQYEHLSKLPYLTGNAFPSYCMTRG
jgi:hypothetical protein